MDFPLDNQEARQGKNCRPGTVVCTDTERNRSFPRHVPVLMSLWGSLAETVLLINPLSSSMFVTIPTQSHYGFNRERQLDQKYKANFDLWPTVFTTSCARIIKFLLPNVLWKVVERLDSLESNKVTHNDSLWCFIMVPSIQEFTVLRFETKERLDRLWVVWVIHSKDLMNKPHYVALVLIL